MGAIESLKRSYANLKDDPEFVKQLDYDLQIELLMC